MNRDALLELADEMEGEPQKVFGLDWYSRKLRALAQLDVQSEPHPHSTDAAWKAMANALTEQDAEIARLRAMPVVAIEQIQPAWARAYEAEFECRKVQAALSEAVGLLGETLTCVGNPNYDDALYENVRDFLAKYPSTNPAESIQVGDDVHRPPCADGG